jgi:hypothetical protein
MTFQIKWPIYTLHHLVMFEFVLYVFKENLKAELHLMSDFQDNFVI